ncbi:Protein of unknown function [Bacillus mycoides]|nr:Protein of unknown function [Bacillus mycoides]
MNTGDPAKHPST